MVCPLQRVAFNTESVGVNEMSRHVRHGHTWAGGFSKTYSAWDNMKGRCYRRKNDPATRYWRKITVCDRWLNSFDNFLEDMGEKPKGLTLDRIDGTKDYTPKNCRWASRVTQSRNSARYCSNTSGHPGVCPKQNRWRAYISVAGRQINLGQYLKKSDAIRARKQGELEYWK